MTRLFILTCTFLMFFSCRKKVEVKEVEVDRKYSWTELKRFTGTEKIFLSSGGSTDALYFQQPFFFTELRNQNENSGITIYGAGLPTDIYLRVPISANYTAYPYSDTVLRVFNNANPTVTPSGGYF